MKKFLLVVLLLGVVYIIGSNVSDAISGQKNAAQAFTTGTANLQVTADKNVKLATKKGKVLLTGTVKIKAATETNVTFLTPTVFKDGQPYAVASSTFNGSIKRITLSRFNTGVTTQGSTVLAKAGTNNYVVQWWLNESALTPGIYTMNLTGYTIASSSTSTSTVYPLTTLSDTTIIRPTTPDATITTLEGKAFRLTSVRGVNVPASSTVDIAFAKNNMTLKACNTISGLYRLSNSRLAFGRLTSTKMACGTVDGLNYSTLEQNITTAFKDQPLVFLTGDTITVSSANAGVFVFKKINPGTGALTNPKIYPCDFVGPIEANAVRNCPNGNTITAPGPAPIIQSLTPTSVRVGATVTLTGTGFTSSPNAVLLNGQVGTVGNVSGNTLTFIVPASVTPFCNTETTCPATAQVVSPGNYKVKVVNANGTSNEAPLIIIQ